MKHSQYTAAFIRSLSAILIKPAYSVHLNELQIYGLPQAVQGAGNRLRSICRTAHAAFERSVVIYTNGNASFNISNSSVMAEFKRQCHLIVVHECIMTLGVIWGD